MTGKKLLIGASIVVLTMLVLLWRQLGDSDATAAAPATKATVEPAPLPSTTTTAPVKAVVPKDLPANDPTTPTQDGKPRKIDAASDEFQLKFQDVVPKKLTMNAAKCYEGIAKRVHRNQNIVYDFKIKIKDGVVTVSDIKVNRNSIDQAGLTSCFQQEILRTTWKDDELPDWEADDQLTISPERGMKKFMRDNIEYVGEPAPAGDDVIRGEDVR